MFRDPKNMKFIKYDNRKIMVEDYRIKEPNRFIMNYNRYAPDEFKFENLSEEQQGLILGRIGTLEKYGLWNEVLGGARRTALRVGAENFDKWYEWIVANAVDWDM